MDNQNHEFNAPEAKVIRMPSLKRGKDDVPLDDRVKLERVLGLTVGSNAALDCDPVAELVAYPAGCTVVLFNIKKNKQSHILNTSRKTITCLAFGPGGKYLATGECGHVPSLRIWSVQDGVQVSEFQGHKYGINCVAFSPNNKYVVSVGSQHDMIVNVWDWKNSIKVASNKVSTRVKAVSFSENGKYFVTVGMRHVKFWYLEHTRSAKYNEPVPLTGRSAILGEQRDNYFCDVACGLGQMGDSTYAITKSGLLCEFSIRRLLDKWVELRTKSANCMTVGENFIFIGCAEGIIRCFSPVTLEFLVTLPRTHYLGVDVASGLDISHLLTHPQDAKYPDAIALAYDNVNKKLTCVYNDHSMYVWDVREIRRVGKSHSFLYHSACIWGVEIYPEKETQEDLPVPSGSFITCSSDDTIRVWNLNNLGNNNSVYRRNIYSNELLKVLYMDKSLTYLKDLDLTSSSEKTDTSYDGKNGVRSVRISPDGEHLASGDREGNIRIHELLNLQQTVMIEAHDAEVLCLEYTKESNEKLLASASRDRLIHVFNVSKGYECVQTLDDHSSSITAVRFINARGQLQMVSCSADKSIIFRQFHLATPGGTKQFVRDHHVAGKTTLYDMEVDCGQKHIMTACQDRNIRVYNVNSGKHSKTFKGSISEDGTLIKVSLDNSGIYVATSCTDKSLSIYDYYSGECMATMLGHSELVTGLKFTNDCKRLISASGDGCIFIWRLPRDMTVTMQARLDQQAVRRGKQTISFQSGLGISDGPEIISDDEPESFDVDRSANIEKVGFKFSVGQLPAWARREIEDQNKSIRISTEISESPEQPIHTGFSVIKINKPPQGRWAQRIENNEIMIATFSPDKQKNIQEPTSKDSSLESHMGKSGEDLKVKELQGSEGVDFDGDVEDSDIETETHYYPVSSDNKMEFTVNANNIEELRRSSRKYKKQQMLKLRSNSLTLEHGFTTTTSNPGTSVSGSQDSDDDDLEDVSSETETPSIERSLGFNVNSVSTESLDLFGQRENYFKNNFESLHFENIGSRKDASGKSISSQYLVRNTAVINAAKQTKTEIEKMRKREELKKRLEDTRRTLKISGLSPSPLKSSQSTFDLSRYPDRNGSSPRNHYRTNQGKSNPAINLLTIFSYPTNKKIVPEKEKSWISSEIVKNSNIYSKEIELCTKVTAGFTKPKTISLTPKPSLSKTTVVHPDQNLELRNKPTNPVLNSNTNNSNSSFYDFSFDSNFDRKNFELRHCNKNQKSICGTTVYSIKDDIEVWEYGFDDLDNADGGVVEDKKVENCVNNTDGDDSNHKKLERNKTNNEFGMKKLLKDVRDEKSEKHDYEFFEPVESVKRPHTLEFSVNSNLSLPDSPTSENLSLSESVRCITDSEVKKAKRRSCSFYIDFNLKSVIEKRKKIKKNQREKEKLLLAHDYLNCKESSAKISDDRSIKNALENLEIESDSEFSSDSLESMSLGQKPPRRCVSDHQIFSKDFRRNLDLSDQKSIEDFSDTDFSGLNSLQGSGDLLEMLKKDRGVDSIEHEGQSGASFCPNRSVYRSTDSMVDLENSSNNRENIYVPDNGNSTELSKSKKKPDAFFVEFTESPRKHKPVVGEKKTSEEFSTLKSSEKLREKLSVFPKPVIGGRSKKIHQTGKKLLLTCGQQVLPNKVIQDEDLEDEEGLRRAISLSDLSASPGSQPGSSQIPGKVSSRSSNLNEFNNARSSSRDQSIVRCSSVGVLSHLDPNTEGQPLIGKKFGNCGITSTGKGLMRPTISSQNKMATTGTKIVNSGVNRRRLAAFSSVNLTTVGVNDDSSSEETGFGRGAYSSDKSNSNFGSRRQSNLGRYGSLKDLSHKAKEVTQRLSSANPKKNKNQEVEKNFHVDVAAAPITKQLCSLVTTQLTQDVDNLIVLHKRLTLEVNKSQNRSHLEQMTEDLEKLAIETQQKLNSLTSKIKNNNSIIRNQLSTNPSNFLGNNLGLIAPNNMTSAPNSFLISSNNPNLMTNVDVSRISEMLISVVQQYTENQQNNQKS